MPLSKKALNYDLDDSLLKEYYPNPKSYKNAWRDVKTFLCKNGFEDRQYSGVVSIKPMNDREVFDLFLLLIETYTWLEPCILKFDVTNVSRQYSLIDKYRINETINLIADDNLNTDIEESKSIINDDYNKFISFLEKTSISISKEFQKQ